MFALSSSFKKAIKVEVDPAYIALLHDILTQTIDKLKKTMGVNVAQMFFVKTADEAVKRILKDYPGVDADDGLRRVLESFGMQVEISGDGKNLHASILCPVANTIHPCLKSAEPICPLTLIGTGVVRRRKPRAIMTEQVLTENGARFSLSRLDRKPRE